MGHYTNMSGYYDVIMTSGYYDYPKIVDGLINGHSVHTVLELGCGTGLIIEELAKRQPDIPITGIDLTPEMLAIAQQRLSPYRNVQLSQQNVCHLKLPQTHVGRCVVLRGRARQRAIHGEPHSFARRQRLGNQEDGVLHFVGWATEVGHTRAAP